jgi:hypothetical protein
MFVEGSKVGVRYYAPSEASPVIFTNSVQADDPAFPPNQWNNVTVPDVPQDCIAVHLVGIAIT